MFGKERYEPADRRFKVARESLSHERVQAVKNAYERLRVEIPEIHFGLSLFGSLSKGKVLRKRDLLRFDLGNVRSTDLDIMCFYDDDDCLSRIHEVVEKHPVEAKKSGVESETITEAGSGSQDRFILSILKTHLTDPLENHLRTSVDLHVQPISFEGKLSILEHVRQVEVLLNQGYQGIAKKDNKDDVYHYQARIALCFGLDVGGGLKKYRQDFLAKLSKLSPAEAEKYWNIVDTSVRFWERENNIPASAEKQFPATFKDAVAYYGLPKSPDTITS